MRPAIFLDRDGTIIEEVGYPDRLERIALFPWSIDAIRLLARADFAVFVITNQAGVAHGLLDEAFVHEAHAFLAEQFAAGGARVDGWYYCPHHPEGKVEKYRVACNCRKPKPGLIEAAARDHAIDLSRSVVVGDKWIDVRLARAVGAKGLLVRTGHGASEVGRQPADVSADAVVDNLIGAAVWILQQPPAGTPARRSADPS